MRFFRPLVRILLLCIGLVFLISCGRDISRQSLADIESILDSRPDSAMALIRQIDTASLRGKAARAKFSLLHAAALDKNYIDTADTRIAQPAVDWYDRHGTPEQRLKAWMYLGIEQYNGGAFSKAIVSLMKSAELADSIEDQNVLGILYSIIADTFTITRDYSLASLYIDKSLSCFRACGRSDQEQRELLRKAGNLVQRRMWADADSCYRALIADSSVNQDIKSKSELDYSMFLLNLSQPKDTLAYYYFSDAIRKLGHFNDPSQKYAFAYLLGLFGEKEGSEKIWKIQPSSYSDNYLYHYWKHREKISSNDFKKAYQHLWLAMQSRDSLINDQLEQSASASQAAYAIIRDMEKNKQIQKQRSILSIASLICVSMALAICSLYLFIKKKQTRQREESERMTMLIESLNDQIAYMKEALKGEDTSQKENRNTKFAFLADLYEEAYRQSGNENEVSERLKEVIRTRVGNLRYDKNSQANFERMVDKEMNGVMTRFREDCPKLSQSEYQMASYYFAGFDNTTVLVIMGISTLENVRTKKKRLRYKISSLYGEVGEKYLSLLK